MSGGEEVHDGHVEEEEEWLYGEAEKQFVESSSEIDMKLLNQQLPVSNEPLDSSIGEGEEVDKLNNVPNIATSGQKRGIEEVEGSSEAGEGVEPKKLPEKEKVDDNNEEEDDEGDEDEEDDEEEDDSDDDGVKVTIGDIKSASFTPSSNPNKRPTGPPPDKKGKFSVEDFDGSGVINGVSAGDFNLDALEDKPWRKPGADITDYFNYGFTEDTWRAYSERQKRLRYEASSLTTPGGERVERVDRQSGGELKYLHSSSIQFPKKFGNLGSGRKDGAQMGLNNNMGNNIRRESPSENTIQVMTADRREYSRKQFEMQQQQQQGGMMGMPPLMHGPPPPHLMGMPPPRFDLSLPPPPFGPRGPPEFMGPPPPEFFSHPPHLHPHHPQFYPNEMIEDYEEDEQQWMDNQWEMGVEMRGGPGPNTLVVPLTKAPDVPPPPGESLDEPPPTKIEPID